MREIVVVDYDPAWPETFGALRARIWPHVRDVAQALEHVGSTSVPGLAAKPTIDLTLVARPESDLATLVERLSGLGYVHRGDLGIPGREAFFQPEGLPPHHLYVCPPGNLGLRNHLAVRDYLRAHPDVSSEYGRLKKKLAEAFPHDIDRYLEGKTPFLLRILRASGFDADQLAEIEEANRA